MNDFTHQQPYSKMMRSSDVDITEETEKNCKYETEYVNSVASPQLWFIWYTMDCIKTVIHSL